MGFDVVHGPGEIFCIAHGIALVAGLEIAALRMFNRHFLVEREGLTGVHHFQLVNSLNDNIL